MNFLKVAKFEITIKFNAHMPMTLSIQIAKFKFRQYQIRAVSPNLMFTKVTRYTEYWQLNSISEVRGCQTVNLFIYSHVQQ